MDMLTKPVLEDADFWAAGISSVVECYFFSTTKIKADSLAGPVLHSD
jgi:hypothetical protein